MRRIICELAILDLSVFLPETPFATAGILLAYVDLFRDVLV